MVREFLNRLGGAAQVAAILSNQTGDKITRNRVAMWATTNHIPHRWRAPIVRIARSLGQDVPQRVAEGVIVEQAAE